MNCETCKYWKLAASGLVGYCRRRAPQVVIERAEVFPVYSYHGNVDRYDVSCFTASEWQVAILSMLVRRFVHAPETVGLRDRAMGYLAQEGLIGTIIRDSATDCAEGDVK